MKDETTTPELAISRRAPESDEPVVEVVRDLSQEEYKQYAEARRLVASFVDDYQQFTMVRNSHAEYRMLLDNYGQRYSSGPPWNEVIAGSMRHEINRRLRGFFTEFRTFLDYAEASLKKNYGRKSDEAKRFKAACSKEFDSSFAYRFIYGLRNYGQHVNLPLQNVRLKSGEFNSETEQIHYLSFEVIRDVLLQSSFDWRPDVEEDLKKLPETFKLDPYIEEVMAALERIHVALVAIRTPEAKRGASYIGHLVSPIKERGTPCVVFGMPGRHGEVPQSIKFKIDEIPMAIAEAIQKFPDPSTVLQWHRLEIDFVTSPREEARLSEGIKNLISGYMRGEPPPGPSDPGVTGTSHDPETGEERPIEDVAPNRLYRVGPLRMTEPDVARLSYLMNELGLSSEQERLGLLERLLSRATDDALWEFAHQAGKSRQEVYMALMRMHPRRGDTGHSMTD